MYRYLLTLDQLDPLIFLISREFEPLNLPLVISISYFFMTLYSRDSLNLTPLNYWTQDSWTRDSWLLEPLQGRGGRRPEGTRQPGQDAQAPEVRDPWSGESIITATNFFAHYIM
jgi:hypothetical protein